MEIIKPNGMKLCLVRNLEILKTSDDLSELAKAFKYLELVDETGSIACLQAGCEVSLDINSQKDISDFVDGSSPDLKDCIKAL